MAEDNDNWPSAVAEQDAIEAEYDPVEEAHLGAEEVYNVQRRIITIPLEGTGEHLARKKEATVWRFAPTVYSKLQHVTATMDRRKPQPHHLEGDLDRAVLLNAEIIEHSNQFSFPVSLDISALMPISLTNTTASVWTIEPHTAPSMVNVNIFAPTNVITKRMFQRYERCDNETLEREFVFPKPGDKSGKMLMAVDGVAMAVLKDSPHAFPGLRLPAVEEGTRYIDLPRDVAMSVYTYMKTKIDAIEQSFTSFKSLEARWSRADDKPFNSFQNLIGESAALEPDKLEELQNMALNTHCRASVKVCLDFVTFPKPAATTAGK